MGVLKSFEPWRCFIAAGGCHGVIVLGKEMCSASSLEAEIDYVKYRLVSWETPHLQRTKYICNSDEKYIFKQKKISGIACNKIIETFTSIFIICGLIVLDEI